MLTLPTITTPTSTAPSPPGGEGIDLRPGSAYEAVTRQMVESLADDLKDIKTRLDNLFYMVIGAIVVDLVARWIGA
ncbi:MAG TPA: hypothetical protein VM450_06270 [Thermomicrobiales bacterium]|nr:hypothetical protein [Thermomicrobiales bacterium]